ncbi:MAG TPA: zf-HC2 domain-containing protein [Gemmatimonadaceae bacterium]|nr:zf-HC2 domain-containing protein [Gemmatimonadaceae bacterium]
MSDDRNVFAAHALPAEEAARESRHEVLRELLGAYADRELPPETVAQIDAHLVGCAECRRALTVHDALRSRLAAERPAAPSPALRARIAAAIDAAPAPLAAPVPAPRIEPNRRLLWVAVAGWATALALGIALVVQRGASSPVTPGVRAIATPVREVPLLDGIVADYASVSRGDLPGRARDLSAVRAAVSFPIEPLRAPDLRLLAAWTTDVRGEPAAVLAYRLRDHLVVQYLVAEDAFFRHPAIRVAVADRHLLTATDSARALVAWPGTATGTVLLGDVPSEWLQTLWSTERSR